MPHNSKDFWRTEAKLSWLLPHERFVMVLKWLLRWGLPGAASVAIIVKAQLLISQNPTLAVSTLVLLAYTITNIATVFSEMYHKGGNAGARLMDDCERYVKQAADKSGGKTILKILNNLEQDTEDTIDRGKREFESRTNAQEFNAAVRSGLVELLARANREMLAIDPNFQIKLDMEPEVDVRVMQLKWLPKLRQRIESLKERLRVPPGQV